MSSKRKDTFSEVIVGLFMLAVLALLVYFTIVISGVDVLQGRRKVEATVAFKDVGGLKDHDNVMYRGMKVGAVDRIELGPDELKVVVEIDRDVVLREGYRISVCDLSMLGGHYLLLEEDAREPLPLTSSSVGATPVDLGRSITHAARRLDEIFSDPRLTNIVASVESASADVAEVARSVREGKGTVGKLLAADDTVYDDLKTTMTNLAAVTTTVREGKGTVGRLLSDDGTVYEDLQATLAGAATVVTRLKNGEGLAGRLLKDDDPLYANLESAIASFRAACDSMDAKATLDSANRLLANLNATAERLKNGEGSLGKLMADDSLYNEVQGLAKDVRQVLDNFRDTTPISTFGSLIMGGL